MPSKSKAQHKLMAAVANNPKFAKKAGIPQNVGADYMKADKKVKKYNRGGVMAHDKKELRNLSDEDYRIRNRSGSNTAAERRRIDGERSYLRNQESSYNMGGKIEKYQAGGMPKSRDGMCSQGQTRAVGQTGTRS
jgi:hypothetical protein